jgi:hypothetical protein
MGARSTVWTPMNYSDHVSVHFVNSLLYFNQATTQSPPLLTLLLPESHDPAVKTVEGLNITQELTLNSITD